MQNLGAIQLYLETQMSAHTHGSLMVSSPLLYFVLWNSGSHACCLTYMFPIISIQQVWTCLFSLAFTKSIALAPFSAPLAC